MELSAGCLFIRITGKDVPTTVIVHTRLPSDALKVRRAPIPAPVGVDFRAL